MSSCSTTNSLFSRTYYSTFFSIDHLAAIILNDFLPYFVFWRDDQPRSSQETIQITRQGHDLWASNSVKPDKKSNTYKVNFVESVYPFC